MTEARMEIKLGIKIKLGDSYQNFLTRPTTHCGCSWSREGVQREYNGIVKAENMIG